MSKFKINLNRFISYAGVGVLALVALFTVGVAQADAAITIQGDAYNPTGNLYLYGYTAAQVNPCSGVGTIFDFSTLGVGDHKITPDVTYNDDDDYRLTSDAIAGADNYIYLCNGVGVGVLNLLDSTHFAMADGNTYTVDIASVVGSANAALNGKNVVICDELGGTKINDVATQVAAQAYSQHYLKYAGEITNNDVYVLFTTADVCTFDSNVASGRRVDVTSGTAWNTYGVQTPYDPDTNVVGDAHVDLAAAKMELTDTDGNSIGLTEVKAAADGLDDADDDYTMYYDQPAAGDMTLTITTAANGTTVVSGIDRTAFTAGYDFVNDVENDNANANGIPNDIADVKTTMTVGADSVVFTTTRHDTYLYDLYTDVGAGAQTVIFEKPAATNVFQKDIDSSAVGDDYIDVGKVSGEMHSGMETNDDLVAIASDNKCTTVVSTATVHPADAAGVDYEIYFEDTGTNFYTKLTEEADATDYVSCGNHFTLTNQAKADHDIAVQVSGTRHADLAAVLVDNDKGGTLTDGDVWTTSFNSDVYHIYTVADATSQVAFDDTDNTFGAILLTTVTEKNFSTDGVVNVAKVTGSDANVHADFVSKGAGGRYDIRVLDSVADNSGALMSSVHPNIDSANDGGDGDTYTTYFEVPADGLVNIALYDETGAAYIEYAYNFTSVAAQTYTFEPSAKVTATVPATILGVEIQQGDLGGYNMRDNVGTFVLYVDKAEEAADNAYDYRAYTDTAFTTLVLDRASKDVSGTATWGVNTITTTNVHADLDGDTDPIDVYSTAGTTADCATTLRSSDTTQVWAAGSEKYYETDAVKNVVLKITEAGSGAVSCVNTLTLGGAAGGNSAYDVDVKTSGSVNADVITVYIDADQNASEDIAQTAIVGSPSTYAIYWAGDGAADISYYNVTPALVLDITAENLSVSSAINVAKLSGNSKDALTTMVVNSDAGCTTAVSSEVVNPGATYAQYFRGTAASTYYPETGDGTYTTCQSSGVVVAADQSTTANFDHTLSGTIPDEDTTTVDALSAVAVAGGRTTWSNTVNGGGTNTYVIYLDGANPTNVVLKSAADAGGSTLLTSGNLDLSAGDGTFHASAVQGNRHLSIQGAGEINGVCGDHSASNTACTPKYSSVQAGAAATYEMYFEQAAAVTTYYLETADADTETYYSWNKFTSGANGAYTNVELDGKLDGSVREAYDTSIRIGEVTIKMYDNGGDPETNQVALTYSYTGTTAPGGNYRMYGNSGTTYDAQYAKGAYITQSAVDTGAISATKNIDLVSGVKIIVREYNSNNLVTDATVSIYACSGATVTTCTTVLDTCTQPSGNCTRTGNNTAGSGLNGEYYFSGIPTGDYIQVKVNKTNYATILDPDPAEADNATYQISASTVQPDGLATANTYFLGNPAPEGTLDLIGGAGTYESAGTLYADVGDDVTVRFDAGEAGLTGVADLSALGGSATQALTDTAGVYTYTQTIGAVATGTKTVTVTVSDGVNTDTKVGTLVVDNTDPTNPVSAGDPGDVSTSTSVTWAWTAATDANSGVAYYEIDLDDSAGCLSPIWTKTTTDLSYTVSGLTNGTTYYMCVQSYDKVGNFGGLVDLDADGILIDTTPTGGPTYQLVNGGSSGNGKTVNGVIYANVGDTIRISFQASEALAGDPTVTIGGQAMAKFSSDGGLYVYTRTLTGAETTTAVINIGDTTDVLGNADTNADDGGVNFEFDFTAPTVAVTAPGTQNSKSFLINATAEADSECRMDELNLAFDDMNRFSLSETAAGTFQGTYIVPTDASYTIYVRCRDYAGNEGTQNSGAFTVKTTQPSVLSIVPTISGGWEAGATVAATLTTNENATCKYDVDESAAYADMDATFTGGGGTTHTATLTNADGINYYYVLCQNTDGVTMTSPITVAWKGDVNNPSVPVRVLPANATKYVTGSVMMWSASTDAGSGVASYTLQIDNDAAFGSPEVNEAGITSTAYALTAGNITALNGGTNYWRVQAVDNAAKVSGYQGTNQTIVIDKTAPTVEHYYPGDTDTGVSASADIVLQFAEEMDISTFTAANIQLEKTSAPGVPVAIGDVFGTPYFSEEGVKKTQLVIYPTADLDPSTEYTLVITAGTVKDLAGNSFAGLAAGDYTFTTAATPIGTLAINSVRINPAKSYATNDNTYPNGWEWYVSLTIPTNEPKVRLKFSDFISALDHIDANANIRYYSAGDTNGHTTEGTAVAVTAANTYPSTVPADYLIFNAGSDQQTDAGYQVVVNVQVKVPVAATGGNYAGQFRVQSLP